MFWRCLVFSLFICLTAHGFENEEHSVSELYQRWLLLQAQTNEPLPKLDALANCTETLTKQYSLVADCWA